MDPGWQVKVGFGLVFALSEIRGVRSRPGVNHRMPVHQVELVFIVPATAQVVAVEVMRGIRRPSGNELPAVLVQVDRDHFPIGLMIVYAAEPGTPAVEAIKEPVLQHDPVVLILAHHAAYIVHGAQPELRVGVIALRRLLIPAKRCFLVSRDAPGGGGSGDAPPQQEGNGEEGIGHARQQPAACQAADAGMEVVL